MNNVFVGEFTDESIEDMLSLKYDKYVFDCSYEAVPYLPYGDAPMLHDCVSAENLDRVKKFSEYYSDRSDKPDISVLLSQFNIPTDFLEDFCAKEPDQNSYIPTWTKTESWKTRFLHESVNDITQQVLQPVMGVVEKFYVDQNKLYTCQIHRPKWHRLYALKILMDQDKLENGVVRFCNDRRMWKFFLEKGFESFNDFQHDNCPTKDELMEYAPVLFSPFKYWPPGMHEHRFPFDPFYNTALFDIVCETHAGIDMFTQKTFQPILLGKPFCIIGTPNANNDIRSLGFEPYDEFFDFSMEHTPSAPLKAPIEVAGYKNILSKLWDLDPSPKSLEFLRNQMMPKIEYNMQVAINLLFDDSILPEHMLDQNRLQLKMARQAAITNDLWKKFL